MIFRELPPVGNPEEIMSQMEEGIKGMLPQAEFHHTVRWYPGRAGRMTYGGLHETPEQAATSFKAVKALTNAAEALRRGTANVCYLNEGDKFDAWGVGRFVHGQTDGTHGSTIPERLRSPFWFEISQRVLSRG